MATMAVLPDWVTSLRRYVQMAPGDLSLRIHHRSGPDGIGTLRLVLIGAILVRRLILFGYAFWSGCRWDSRLTDGFDIHSKLQTLIKEF
jgi:hypothetical protein